MTLLTLSPAPRLQFLDANGNPYTGAKLFTYASGTTTKISTYADSGAVTANANPVILDAAGRALIYLLPQAYKFVLAPSNDTDPPVSPYFTTDPVGAVPTTTVDTDITGTAGEDLTVGMPVFMSSGAGGNTAGRWYRATAASSDGSIGALSIGFVPATIVSGESGSIRLAGRITGLSGLTEGTIYYAALTPAGTLTATAPANARVWGVADSATSIIIGEKRPDQVTRVASSSFVGNVGAGEDILFSYTDGVDGLYSSSMGWEMTFYGTTTNNANTKTLRLRAIEGANNNIISTSALTVNEAGRWMLQAIIQRSSGTTFNSAATVISGPANAAATFVAANSTQSGTLTFANAIEIRLTGEATTNNDIVMSGGMLKRIGPSN